MHKSLFNMELGEDKINNMKEVFTSMTIHEDWPYLYVIF